MKLDKESGKTFPSQSLSQIISICNRPRNFLFVLRSHFPHRRVLSPRWETLSVSPENRIVCKLMVRRSMTTPSNLYQLIHRARWAGTHRKAVGIHDENIISPEPLLCFSLYLCLFVSLSLIVFHLTSSLKPHDHDCRYPLSSLCSCVPALPTAVYGILPRA